MYTNRLLRAHSPYLLQHAHNPVDWYEWGDEALARARAEDRPILVSIGYSACHWCHVMERECFENPGIAALMNAGFVCIKVDREERPDLDDLYMTACQAITGSGGWPLNVFLTPDLKPFHAGTYFPPDDRYGRPGFPRVLEAVARAYRERREAVEDSGQRLAAILVEQSAQPTVGEPAPAPALLSEAVAQLRSAFDPVCGGFGAAPKFPAAMTLELLLRHALRTGDSRSRQMATLTLDRMAQGGMYDQIGGGFHRYSVDERWLVPHFEKMLYDNALLARAYLLAYQVTRSEEHARVARETLDYVLRDMADEGGGFHAATDADSEGEEGRYFVWDRAEVESLLGSEAELFCACYGVTAEGNFEGRNILHVPVRLDDFAAQRGCDPIELRTRLGAACERLRLARGDRVPPAKDDKVLADWNGLVLSALARGYGVLGDVRYRVAAERVARFILSAMRPNGRLCHAYRSGEAYLDGFLDDHAFVLEGLVDLYEATLDRTWLTAACEIACELLARFWDGSAGFYFAPADRTDLIARPRKVHDGATPSGSAIAAWGLLRLGRLTAEPRYTDCAEATLAAARGQLSRLPLASPALLCALDWQFGPVTEIVISGPSADPATEALRQVAAAACLPNRLLVGLDPDSEPSLPLTEGKSPVGGRPAAHVCDARGCLPPTGSPDELRALLTTW